MFALQLWPLKMQNLQPSGFSLKGITRAIFEDLQTGSLQVDLHNQQLVKNVLLICEKTLHVKLKS
jgi:membrane carboxypeptidase/penicillin-binding protein